MRNISISSAIHSAVCSIAFLAAAAYAPATAHGDQAIPDPFAGEWAITAVPDSEAAGEGQGKFEEAVLFHENQFSAAVFAMFGFAPANYTVALDDERPVFTATLSSEDRGTLVWTGSESPTGLDGSLVWTRTDGQVFHYDLTGERQ